MSVDQPNHLDLSSRLVDLASLLRLLGGQARELASFEWLEAEGMPAPYQQLLAHPHHMTVAVESFHGCPVNVQVLQSHREADSYFREILLRRQSDGEVVQYGIVRLQLGALEPEVRQAILAEQLPLGRVLIQFNVLRDVELVDLWKVILGPRLADLFSRSVGDVTYGRTAIIHFGTKPALELLEILRLP
jgi:hypothetical protein